MEPAPARVFAFGDFRLDASSRRLLRAGEAVALTPKVFDTLLYLVEHRGAVLGRDELLAALWPDVVVEENNLGQAISKLRQALGEAPGDNRYIITVPGRGYRFAAHVTLLPEVASPDRSPAVIVPPEGGAVDPDGDTGARDRAEEPLQWSMFSPRALTLTALALAGLGVVGLYVWSPRAGSGADVHPPRTLAVLPFIPLVPQGGDEALELGMADSLITSLGHFPELTVRPLSAVRKFHDPARDPLAAGRELGVEAVLDASFHRAGDLFRVTGRLLRTTDGKQLWAKTFDEQLTSIFGVLDAISVQVTGELAIRLTAQEEQQVIRRYTDDAGAVEAHLNGRFFLSQAQPRNAIEMFERALDLDPDFALAKVGLADTLSRIPMPTDGPSDEIPRARELALEALEIDDELGAAYAVLGWIGFYYDWDWVASEQYYLQALRITPGDFSARLGYAHLLSNTYRSEEAIHEVDRALAADSLSPLAGTLKSQFLFHAGLYAAAHEQLDRTFKISPAFWIGQVMRGRMHLREGRHDDAVAEFTKAADAGVWTPRALAAYTYAVSGRRDAALRMLTEMVAPGSAAPPYLVALVHLGLGDRPQALTWLERAYAEKDVRMVFLGVDPLWAPLRDEERFANLLRRMNL